MSEEREPVDPQETPTPNPEGTPAPEGPQDGPDRQPGQSPDQAVGESPSTPQEPPATPSPPPAPVRTDWRDRRIGEQQQRIRELRTQLEQFQGQVRPQEPDQTVIARQIEERAQALAAANDFTRRCNETAEVGRKSFGEAEFNSRVRNLTGMVDFNDPGQASTYNGLLAAAMETGEGARLIYQLGNDLDEASRMMALTPIKMAVELTKMAAKPVPEVSRAPRPLNPVASQAVSNRSPISPDDADRADGLSTEEWMRRREEQISTRRQTR